MPANALQNRTHDGTDRTIYPYGITHTQVRGREKAGKGRRKK